MAGKLVATAVVDVDNMISDTDDSGSYIEVEVDSDGNEIISGITISNPNNNMKAIVKTTSASVGVTKAVAWPPREERTGMKSDGMGEIISSAAKKYVKSVESTNSEQHNQYTLSRELFKPGRMNSDDLWKPNTQLDEYPEQTIVKMQTPRRTFKSLEDVLQGDQSSNPVKHSSYHVPPGTTRTRKAQDNYTKHLEIVTK